MKRLHLLKTILGLFLMGIFIVSFNDTAFAAKKKNKNRKSKTTKITYSKSKAKAEAIQILKTSESVAEIAGLEVANESKSLTAYSDVELLKSYVDANNSDELGEYGEDLAELEAEDDVQVNIDELDFRSLWLSAMGDGGNVKTSYGVEKSELMATIMKWLGTPYKFGGMETSGIDCSAWTQKVFFQTDSISLPRTAREQINVGRKIKREKLEFGDLVFFHTYSRKFASHVGIYLGDDLFAHASSRKGVTVSSLKSTFYDTRFIVGKRLSANDTKIASLIRKNNY